MKMYVYVGKCRVCVCVCVCVRHRICESVNATEFWHGGVGWE